MTPLRPAPRRAWVAVLAALAARLVPFWLAIEHYGDAPVRIEAAERWIAAPHLWRGFSEAFQYGPLHLTLLGLSVQAFGRYAGPRLLALAFGLLGVWLLYRLAERAAGADAALLAALGLALSPIHIQASTSGASEAVFLAPLLGAVLLVLEARGAERPWPRLIAAALLVGLAGLVRYDGWLYAGLLALLLAWDARGALRPSLRAAGQ
jgi:4-amino-4-deoxy-L-arabinose transferase-like glycosyltransferase